MDLREYEQSKFAIAEILRSAATRVPEQKTEREQIEGLFARLAEDRFNLVVVGRFNRGKTSLMNAILGSDRLPTGIVPLTSVITTVRYGSKERVILKYDHRSLDTEIPIESLPQHITQQGNPGNVQRIKTAEVQLPAEILRRGFYFVDTPGLGSVIVENTLTTEAFLPEADAFVLVTSYESPLSDDEMRFFKAGSSSGRRIFVILNKQDTVAPEQRQTVLSFVREQLDVFFGRVTPPIFSVSSTDGLQAKLLADEARLAASGIPNLEKELISFLLNEKSSEFLLQMCDRAREFLHELRPSAEIENLRLRIGSYPQDRLRAQTPSQICIDSPRAKSARRLLISCGIFCASINTKSSSATRSENVLQIAAASARSMPGNSSRQHLHTACASATRRFSIDWRKSLAISLQAHR
jgi:small GTP-binding protein